MVLLSQPGRLGRPAVMVRGDVLSLSLSPDIIPNLLGHAMGCNPSFGFLPIGRIMRRVTPYGLTGLSKLYLES